jgi:hypothetical protein
MRTILLLFSGLVLFASPAFADNIAYECSPETGSGDEMIQLSLNLTTNKASLMVDGTDIRGCQNVTFTGQRVEYGESEILIQCQNGEVSLRQNYDETVLDVTSLNLGLSDHTYMCN